MFHGIEELSKDWEGYVYWRGRHVEHYSYRENVAGEKSEAEDLTARCRHLESLGVDVTCGSAIWSYSWFSGLKSKEDIDRLPVLVRDLILSHRDLYEDDRGRFCWIAERTPDPAEYPFTRTCRVVVFDHGTIDSFHMQTDTLGNHYHPFKALGWTNARMGQNDGNGCCYATTEQVLGWFRAKGAF